MNLCEGFIYMCEMCKISRYMTSLTTWSHRFLPLRIETSLRETEGTMTMALPYRQKTMVKSRLKESDE